MSPRCRKPRPLSREDKTYRDDRLFVIATGDTHAPEQYFDIFKDSRIKLLILPTEDCHSAPEHVFKRMDDYRKKFETMDDDECWLMLDTDHRVEPNKIGHFKQLCAEAGQKGYQLAISNPCFEAWLLLHVADIDENEQFNKCEEVVKRLRKILGEYSKRTVDPKHFSPETAIVAVARAEKLDDTPADRWPQKTGSHVYKVVKKLLEG